MQTLTNIKVIAPGARVVIRDAEWLVRRVDTTNTGGKKYTCIGISEIVKDKEAIFLDEVEKAEIEVLDPAQTKLVQDQSRSYQASLLYIESLMRQTAPTDDGLYIGYKAAMDSVPYQFEPIIKALDQVRQRILIADAVGLGKTLEAGILVSELIKRGKGKRILVVAVKSMLTQFQKEFWSRFTIPLTRLDSTGIQRVRNQIPSNHNPFYYYDKSIISIDTLKQDAEYRTFIENAYWDIIIIDEAHNVADRGTSSKRNKLAELLAHRSDTLLLLSATPHDGKARSFASLMNMLDPTAIANPDEYTKDDIKGLFIRRFKKDIQEQVSSSFKEREISVVKVKASRLEEAAFESFVNLSFKLIDQRRTRGQLFKTTLEKALFSSPYACSVTLQNRIKKLNSEDPDRYKDDINQLSSLDSDLAHIGFENYAKYQKLLSVIKDRFQWSGKAVDDRIVIFTERIETLNKLRDHLIKDLDIQDDQVEILHGGLSDLDQQEIVENFGKEEAPVRILLASDVASEGINLHYLCHRMIHFDIPWSLMVFQQRNGRIDRYGQERTPEIVYLVTESTNEKIKGDTRILEVLIEKDEQAAKNIDDPSAFAKVFDIEEEEAITARAIETGMNSEQFLDNLNAEPSLLDILLSEAEESTEKYSDDKRKLLPVLFNNDYDYFKAALEYLKNNEDIQFKFKPEAKLVEISATEDIRHRFKFMPKEIYPENGYFILSSDQKAIQREIKRSRKDADTWPNVQYLWEQHPLMTWVNDKLLASFGRNEAPILKLPKKYMSPNETKFIITAMNPSRKGHPLIHFWLIVNFVNNKFSGIELFDEFQKKFQLGLKPISNTGNGFDTKAMEALLPSAINEVTKWMETERADFENRINTKLDKKLAELEALKGRQYDYHQLSLLPDDSTLQQDDEKAKRKRQIDQIFDEFMQWVEDSMTTEKTPYIQVVAALVGGKH
ncbi:MAG: hypothetical protein RLZZ361_739 [Cyanobacteriota bacterium]|jgi:superfamily II DNA or RNA helicase